MTQETLVEVPLAELRPALEAVLMVADQPLDHLSLASAVGYPAGEVVAALDDLAREYTEQGRGFDLRHVAGGWRFYTREEFAPVVERFVLDGQQARLTQAALETLAVVAYKQRGQGPLRPARRGGLQAAGQPRPDLGDPGRERRRRDPDAAGARPGGGGRTGRRDDRDGVPDDQLLPGADRRDLAGRPAGDRAVPALDGGLRA